jgi:Holliday junction resolvase
MTNSRAKGARGERELANTLTKLGYQARRGQQFSGLEGEDVICESLPCHWEVKRVERFRLYPSLAQAERDAKAGRIPVVAHRSNGREWVAIVSLAHWVEAADAWQRIRNISPTDSQQ